MSGIRSLRRQFKTKQLGNSESIQTIIVETFDAGLKKGIVVSDGDAFDMLEPSQSGGEIVVVVTGRLDRHPAGGCQCGEKDGEDRGVIVIDLAGPGGFSPTIEDVNETVAGRDLDADEVLCVFS